jgi:hypothetical protein
LTFFSPLAEFQPDLEEVKRQSSLWQQAKFEAKRKEVIEGKLVHGEPFMERKSTFQVSCDLA